MAQEAMVKIVMGLDSYQINQPFKPWLRRVVINTRINFLRRRSPVCCHWTRISRTVLTLGIRWPQTAAEIPRCGWNGWKPGRPWKRPRGIAAGIRLVLTLRHREGMSYKEIADSIGIPVGTVKTYLFRARNRLRRAERYLWMGGLATLECNHEMQLFWTGIGT